MKLADLTYMNVSFRKATQRDNDFAFQTKKTLLTGYVDQIWGWDEQKQVLLHARRFIPDKIRVIRHLGYFTYRSWRETGCLRSWAGIDGCARIPKLFTCSYIST